MKKGIENRIKLLAYSMTKFRIHDLRVRRQEKHLLVYNVDQNMNPTSLEAYLPETIALSLSCWASTRTFHGLGERAPKAKNEPYR